MPRLALRLLILFLSFLLTFSLDTAAASFSAGQNASQQTPASAAGGQPSAMPGIWLGSLDINGINLRLVLKVTSGPDGKLAGKLDSLDQGANDLPIDTISFQDGRLRFAMNAIGASYEGTLSKDGQEVSGQWSQGPTALPLVFRRTDKAPTLNRPQDPQKPYPYDEEEVVYENKRDGVKLAGTLTLPRAKGPFPAALLITGSGPQDRNETLLGHRPFLVLADYLTRKGVAVLRTDDRGVGGSTRGTPNDTSENYAMDVRAGIEFLKTRREINSQQIGLIGHSEGGMIAPMVAAQTKDVAFIVLIAGPGTIGDRLILKQSDLLAKAGGAGAEQIAATRALLERAFAILKEEKNNQAAEKLIRDAIAQQTAAMTEEQRKAFAATQTAINSQVGMYVSPWFRYFLTYDPHPVLLKVTCPVLAINGEKDLQVPADENLAAIAAALKAGGNKDLTTLKLPGLNHLLQTSRTGSPAEYRAIEETMSPAALEIIADWILKRTLQRKTVAAAITS